MSTDSRRLGKYELEKRLGQGGMAEVWKAFDTQLHRYVAIKMLHANFQNDPDFRARFQREAQLIASLHHPNIVQIHDFQIAQSPDSENPVAYMVMDYVEGQTLAEYIRSTSRMGKFPPPAEVVHIFTSISMAIDYAHSNGMVHRDIKPANILLDKRHTSRNPVGEPVLSDFGIAKLMGTTTAALSGTWIGTPLYVAPEQALGQPGNERSDIYSLGAILYEIFTGIPPFQGDTPAAIMMQQVNALPTPPALINPNIPPAVTVVIMRCLAKNPAARFPSASSLTAALAEALNVPIPSGMGQPSYPADSMNMPTVLTPQSPNVSGISSASSPWPVVGIASAQPTSPFVTPQFVQSPSYAQMPTAFLANQQNSGKMPVLPGGNSSPSLPVPAMPVPAGSPSQSNVASPYAPAMPPAQQKRRRPLLILSIALIVLMLAGSGLAAFLLASQHSPTPTTNNIVGHVYFISSGQVSETSTQGFTDELQLDLYNVKNPAPGNAYYGWLEGDTDNTMEAPLLLGKLNVVNGQIHFFYPGDANHTNLLSVMSRFLITEEPVASVLPKIPSPDKSTWRYFAEFPQPTDTGMGQPTSTSSMGQSGNMMQMGVTDHLRHLLVQAPELQQVGLVGGVDLWLFRNTEKILEWSGSARDEYSLHEEAFMSRQILRILDYLDGISPALKQDAPNQPVEVSPQVNAHVSLLDLDPTHHFVSLLYLMDTHLNGLIQSPDTTSDQRQLAVEIDTAVKNIEIWLDQVHTYARQLEPHLFTQAMFAPANLAILNNMYNTALYAFAGRIDASTGKVQEGVIQAHYDVQRLATLDIKAYQSH
jgi:serine/threonine protein kinase